MERIKKEDKEKFMEKIRKAGSEKYETEWNAEGRIGKQKKKSEKKKGKLSKGRGARFELKVRGELESRGRVIDKWSNNVDLEEGKLIKAKRKYNPFKKMLVVGTGFPDFVSIKHVHGEMYSVVGVEVKMNGILSKIEKEKCAWYLKNKIFSQIWIAKKGALKSVSPSTKKKDLSEEGKKRGKIEYVDFKEKYGKKYPEI